MSEYGQSEYGASSFGTEPNPSSRGAAEIFYPPDGGGVFWRWVVRESSKAASTSAVSATRALPYSVGGIVSATRALPFTLAGSTSATRALPYAVAGATAATRRLPYAIGTAAVRQRGSVRMFDPWSVFWPRDTDGIFWVWERRSSNSSSPIQRVGATRRLPYSLAGRTSATRALPYSIGLGGDTWDQGLWDDGTWDNAGTSAGTVTVTRALPYTLKVAASATRVLPYGLAGATAAIRRLPYTITASSTTTVAATRRLRYDVLMFMSVTRALPYTIATPAPIVSVTRRLPYTLIGRLAVDIRLPYSLGVLPEPIVIEQQRVFRDIRAERLGASGYAQSLTTASSRKKVEWWT